MLSVYSMYMLSIYSIHMGLPRACGHKLDKKTFGKRILFGVSAATSCGQPRHEKQGGGQGAAAGAQDTRACEFAYMRVCACLCTPPAHE